ncbi:hypothetical protein [Azospirillum halopraeferens]|uniref:hypothetical protein n=1 Tax=Azospirillum halopraeferens TaxID=34010 RepID=UPI00041E7484|nr:hypothetical protein [Azospirillum halopraeferens]
MRVFPFGDALRNWLGTDDPPAKRTPAAPAGTEPRDDGERERLRTLQRRLRELLAQPQLLATGRVHMINLDRVRERLGAAWPEQRDRILDTADRVIDRHLGSRDVRFRAGEGEYIVVFASLDREAAKLVCAKIAEELHRLFLGNPDLRDVRIATAVATVDGTLLYDRASVADLLVEAGRAATAPDAGEAGAGTEGAPDAAADEAAALQRLRLAGQEFERIDSMFRPVWDVERQVISTYMCTPVRHFPDRSMLEGSAVLEGITQPQRLARINADALVFTAETLDELFRNKFRLMVSVPVCFETLAARRTRQDYIGLCQSIPDYLRRFITFELLRFPAGVPNGRLTDLVNELRPFCRWTFLRVDLKQTSFSNLIGSGLTGVTAAVPADRAAEARAMEELNGFVAAAERAHLHTCVVGINTTSLALAARGAGITFIAGDRIGGLEEIPQHMLRFDWQDLFRRGRRRT